MKPKSATFDIVLIICLVLLSALFIYPIYYIFVAALSSPVEVFKNPILLYPKGLTLYNFSMLFNSAGIWKGYLNTIIYMVLGTAINIVLTVAAGYALAQEDLPFRGFFSFMITFTMFFSGGIIPSFLVVQQLGMLDTIWAVVLPGAVSTWNLMITRTYIQSQIPQEMREAAEIDGAGEYGVFFRIILPLIQPIIIVIALFYASTHWNSWFNAMIYIRDRAKYPLQIYLREMLIDDMSSGMLTEAGSDTALHLLTLKYAVMIMSILPLLVVFPFVQKHFVKGVMIGAIKG